MSLFRPSTRKSLSSVTLSAQPRSTIRFLVRSCEQSSVSNSSRRHCTTPEPCFAEFHRAAAFLPVLILLLGRGMRPPVLQPTKSDDHSGPRSSRPCPLDHLPLPIRTAHFPTAARPPYNERLGTAKSLSLMAHPGPPVTMEHRAFAPLVSILVGSTQDKGTGGKWPYQRPRVILSP